MVIRQNIMVLQTLSEEELGPGKISVQMNQCLSRVEFRYPYLVERQIIVVPYSQRDGDDGSSIGSRLSTATGKTKRP